MVGYSEIKTKEQFQELFNNVDATEVENEIDPSYWYAPSPGREIGPTALFTELLTRIQHCWNRNCEATTRTYIDQVNLDVLWTRRTITRDHIQSKKVYKPYGEVWSESLKYSERADYSIGYTDLKNASNFLLVVEAKKFQSNFKPWQLLSIMAHYQKIRKDSGKLTCTVFGILSDSDRWIF